LEEQIILVNEADEMVGIGEKMQAHKLGKLHRAFSIFVFNSRNQLLLQKRAAAKYHSRSLWSNTCCGHPRPGETIPEAAQRRLQEEMGFDCELKEVFDFIYKVELDTDLCEYEYDHVLIGKFDGRPIPNKEEVDDWSWTEIAELRVAVKENSKNYTYWLRACVDAVLDLLPVLEFEERPALTPLEEGVQFRKVT
jgi:isopentenyl-diphosphate delta-isomerase